MQQALPRRAGRPAGRARRSAAGETLADLRAEAFDPEEAGRARDGLRARSTSSRSSTCTASGADACALVAGVDSSTQSCKVVVVDADTGRVVRQGRAAAPRRHRGRSRRLVDGVASEAIAAAGGLDDVAAVVRRRPAARHGLRSTTPGRVVRPALLWNDTRSAGAAAELTAELGGPQAWADAVGIVPVASFTVTKLRWLADHEPEAAARTGGRLPAARLAHLAPAGDRALDELDHRPQRRQRHRLLVGRRPASTARPAAARARARRRGAPGRRPRRVVGPARTALGARAGVR